MKGAKPTPTVLKILRGNPGKRKIDKSEMQPPIAVPEAPDNLKEPAMKEWVRISGLLGEMKILTELDMAALAAYCDHYGRWYEATSKLRKRGLLIKTRFGDVVPNPLILIVRQASEAMMKILCEFGMTPSSRVRIHGARKPDGEDDEMAEWEKQAKERKQDAI